METNRIIEKTGYAACLEQLAEEASELAQAALKMARIIRGENPTPVTWETATDNLREEVSDVRLCIRVLEEKRVITDTTDLETQKLQRRIKRLEEQNFIKTGMVCDQSYEKETDKTGRSDFETGSASAGKL